MADHLDIFEEIVRLRREGTPAAMATIVGTRGSTPGQETMRLLVLEDGTFLGTVGGGCLEAEVYDAAREVIRDETPRTLKFRLTRFESPDSGLLCGGEVTIFVEPITTPRLTVFGGGHVSKALVKIATMAGFGVEVADDRATYACRTRFPEARRVICQSYVDAVADMPIGASSYAVIVTRGHKEDGVVLEALARRWEQGSRLKFLGMIGSRTKRGVLFRHLREAGVPEAFLATVRSPVGLCLGARSHEEIAVAVVGELISVRRLGQTAEQAWRDRPSRKLRAGGRSGPVEIDLPEDQNLLGEAGSAAS